MITTLYSHITELSVVEMVTLFPAYNGVFGLSVTTIFLFWTVNDNLMDKYTNSLRLNVANIILVLFSIYITVNSGRGVLEAVFGGMPA